MMHGNSNIKNQSTYLIISRSVLLTMKNVAHEFVKKIKSRVLCSVLIFPKNGALYEIKEKNILEPDRPQMTTWRLLLAC